MNGIQVIPLKSLEKIKDKIEKILLAIPSASNRKKRNIIDKLKKFKIPVFMIPSISELTSGASKIDSIMPISIDDLLGRESAPPDLTLMGKGITNKNICITGAGGSIGSELSKQINNLKPNLLILLENNEHNLYKISQELRSYAKENISIKPVLVLHKSKICRKDILRIRYKRVFHSAAYKHVPIVESNPITGLTNNILSTKAICFAAKKFNLEKVILISSDKAVRPTNIMGASKIG